ncbi:hypothetical protein IMX26_04915 [Clostridium sp. 'deep sea']|uniref:hypothetical protein n=1 Tax=Clostridium sp. 'deep sea' TaxID=2779445 RepID=UPI0018969096|nr:hypothetical protein [Clostridium sp. 'deep sea']QOR36157.1 hypothetical protein IMX26_04915 [Clostridium sp. 'deep sea']
MKKIIRIVSFCLLIIIMYSYKEVANYEPAQLNLMANITEYHTATSNEFEVEINFRWNKTPLNSTDDFIVVFFEDDPFLNINKSQILCEYFNDYSKVRTTVPLNENGEAKIPHTYTKNNRIYYLYSGKGKLYFNNLHRDELNIRVRYLHNTFSKSKQFHSSRYLLDPVHLPVLAEVDLNNIYFDKPYNPKDFSTPKRVVVYDEVPWYYTVLNFIKNKLILINILVLACIAPVVDQILIGYKNNEFVNDIILVLTILILLAMLFTITVILFNNVPINYGLLNVIISSLNITIILGTIFLIIFLPLVIKKHSLHSRLCRLYTSVIAIALYAVLYKSMLS